MTNKCNWCGSSLSTFRDFCDHWCQAEYRETLKLEQNANKPKKEQNDENN